MNFQIGDNVKINEENAQALFGRGVHTVEKVCDNVIRIKLWHGKRSINMQAKNISHVTKKEMQTATAF